ncbi:MAG TPA: TIM-barrel domain-containing protein [Solirubrobacterales bacterium]|nr:TIM-barrel domain-containing protein [Solirubrobacterales bacterium]
MAPASVAAQVSAGPLRAELGADPWQLRLADAAGATVLEQHPGLGTGPTGTLGFRTLPGWSHATRVASGGQQGNGYVAQLETTDPSRDIAVTIEPAGEGVIRLSASIVGDSSAVTAIGIGFAARPGERYLGFGERSNAVDQRGNEVENYVSDGPYEADERVLVDALIPDDGFHPRDDATYFPMPWLLSTAGYGVLLDNTELSYHRLGSDDPSAWSVETEASGLSLRFVAGPTPADVLRRLTGITGRQPPPAAPWVLGPWHQPTGSNQLGQAQRLRDLDVPGSATNTYLHYLPCGSQQGVEAQQPVRTSGFHELGYAITTYFNPMICTDYAPAYGQAVAAEALTKDGLGDPYVYQYAASPTTPDSVSQFDFSSQAGRGFFQGRLSEAVAHGYDGWMEDFGEYTPLDSASANGMSGAEMHNLYPAQYHCASWEYAGAQSRPLVPFIRSGWTGVHPCAQVVWGGDPTTDWGFDGIDSAIKQALSLGTSGISRWGSDIGGFFSLVQDKLTPEMLIRWIELGAVSGVMRTEANGVKLDPDPRPQIFDQDVLPVWRRYAKLRTQLFPYVLAAEAEYRRSGMPLMRHLALTHPGDPAAVAREDEFMFGPDLLAAPVRAPGDTARSLYLPAGRWIDFWRAVSYREAQAGSLRLGRARALQGGREVSIPAPLEELPLMVRAGATLALLPPTVDTLAPYGSGKTVRLDDAGRRLHLIAFPRGRSVSAFRESGRLVSRVRRGRWTLGIRGAPRHRIDLQASLSTAGKRLRPCEVRVGGRVLKRGKWSVRRKVLRARFKTRARKRTRVAVLNGSACERDRRKARGRRGERRR